MLLQNQKKHGSDLCGRSHSVRAIWQWSSVFIFGPLRYLWRHFSLIAVSKSILESFIFILLSIYLSIYWIVYAYVCICVCTHACSGVYLDIRGQLGALILSFHHVISGMPFSTESNCQSMTLIWISNIFVYVISKYLFIFFPSALCRTFFVCLSRTKLVTYDGIISKEDSWDKEGVWNGEKRS